MNITRKRIVIYVFLTLLFTTACDGCYIIPGTQRTVGEFNCVSEGYSLLRGTTEYKCFCPLDPSYSNTIYDITAKDFSDPEGMKSKACTDYYLTKQFKPQPNTIPPTEPPTEAPTEEAPTEAPTEPPLASILGGRVSYCSVNEGQYYMNLPFNSGANPETVQKKLDDGSLIVQINGTTTTGRCKALASNTILLCAFPASSFPAFGAANTILNVVDKGTIIDVIPFNNSCEAPQQLNSGGSGGEDTSGSGGTGGSGGVPACDPHIDLTCPIDCSLPSNADFCG